MGLFSKKKIMIKLRTALVELQEAAANGMQKRKEVESI